MQLGLGLTLVQGVGNRAALPEILLNFATEGGGNMEACALGPGEDPYYIDTLSSRLYQDAFGLTPAPDGDYSEGTVYYHVTGGAGSYTGPTICPEA